MPSPNPDAVAREPMASGGKLPLSTDGSAAPSSETTPSVSVSELFQFASAMDRALIAVGTVCAFLSGACRPAFAFIMGKLISKLSEGGDVESDMANLALYMVYLGIGIFVFSAVFVVCFQVSGTYQVHRMQQRYFASVLQQDMGWHDEHKPGALTARMVGDTKVILAGINDNIGIGVRCLGMFLAGFTFGFIQSWELTLVMLGCMPLIGAMGAFMATTLKKYAAKTREHFADASDKAMEAMENVKITQAFGAESFEQDRFGASLGQAKQAGIRKAFVSNTAVGATYFIMYSCYTILFFFSSYLLEWNRIEVGEILGTFFAVLMGSFGVGMMVPSITAFKEAQVAAFHVIATIARKPTIDVAGGGLTLPDGLQSTMSFRDVRFAYPSRKDQTLFRNFNLTIKKGTTVAFSGASGCGKSSIVALLQRFYDPDDGTVEIDGKNLATMDVMWWRSQIGIVSQEPSLFSGSIADNVRVGMPDATLEDVQDACRKANIHDTICSLTQGYDTPVGSVGSQLSGGQKQRIAIARAIIKRPKILLLDEATSALDRQSEMEVQRALNDIVQKGVGGTGDEKLTVIIVAHRLTTIRDADVIYYLTNDGIDRGCVVSEVGSYDALLQQNGMFAAMVQRQCANAHEDGSNATSPTNFPSPSRPTHDHTPTHTVPTSTANGSTEAVAENALKETVDVEVEEKEVPMSRIIALNRDNAWAVLLAFVGSAITGGVYPAYAVILGKIMTVFADAHADFAEMRRQTPLFATLFLAIGAGSFLGHLLQSFYAVAGERLTVRIRSMLFRSILRQDQTFFDMPGRDAGSLLAILSGDAEAVHQLWGPSIGYKLQMLCAAGGGIVVAFVFTWRLALVTLSTLPALAFGSWIQRMMTLGHTQRNLKDQQEDTITAESFSNIRTVTSFNLQQARSDAYNYFVRDATRVNIFNAWGAGIAFGFSQFVSMGVAALTYWYGGRLISHDLATFQDVLTCAMAIMMAGVGAGEAGGFGAKLTDSVPASKRVFAVIDRTPAIDVDAEGGDTDLGNEPGVGCDVHFHNVAFAYPARPSMTVLSSFSASMPSGSQSGLIGQTGSGKSTIVQLLGCFYRPAAGNITINGKDITTLDLRTWRRSLSIVLQEPALFSGSIVENIRYSKPSATMDQVVEAAKLAAIHEDIMKMPDQYETAVGYRGRALSGGQKQRVAIARGLLRAPSLLLLDEATSALDNATEAVVQQGLRHVHRERQMTVISIAHRLTTIQHCDTIIVLDKGVVIEQGNHEALMDLDGEYKRRFDVYHSSTNATHA